MVQAHPTGRSASVDANERRVTAAIRAWDGADLCRIAASHLQSLGSRHAAASAASRRGYPVLPWAQQ